MSNYGDRLNNLRKLANSAEKQLIGLPAEAWPSKETRERCLGVFGYVQVVLEASDAQLLSDNAFTQINAALTQFDDDPAAGATNADPWSSTLIDAVNQLPAARDRDVEQAVKDAAAKFQNAATQRLNALKDNFSDARDEIKALELLIAERKTELSVAIGERKTEITNEIEALQTAFETKLTDYETQLESERAALSKLRTSQTAAFEEAEEQRGATAKDRLAKVESDLAALQETASAEVAERVAEIRRMEEESAQLVGAIGLAGTAERYGVEAKEQRKAANTWRWITVVLALAAVAVAIAVVGEESLEERVLIGRLALSGILGGLATYTARQSARHRGREEAARALQLELTAFSPFIEPLTREQQEEERVIMTRKTFGKTTKVEASEEEPGPTAISFLLQRRQKQAATEESSA